MSAYNNIETTQILLIPDVERLSSQYRRMSWLRFIPRAIVFAGAAWVATVPYLKLSESPFNLLKDTFDNLAWKGFLYVLLGCGVGINGLELYPRQTTMLAFKLGNLGLDVMRGRLNLPFLRCGGERNRSGILVVYWVFLLGTALAAFSAFLAGQIFRNALESLSGIDEWVKFGMVGCRIAIIFNSLMEWINLFIGCRFMANTNTLQERVSQLHGHVLKDMSKKFGNEHGEIGTAQKAALDHLLASLLQTTNISIYLRALSEYCVNWGFRPDQPFKYTTWALAKKTCKAAVILTISIFATTGQLPGVLKYYDILAFGLLALFAICFGLYCDNVRKALNYIFDRESYKKEGSVIARQLISGVGGGFSGLPSTAVFIAANSLQDAQPLLEGPFAYWAQIICTYLNGALLNAWACLSSLIDLKWWFDMLRGSRPGLSETQQEKADARSFRLGIGELFSRVTAELNDWHLRRDDLAYVRDQVIGNGRINWGPQVGSSASESFSTPLLDAHRVILFSHRVQAWQSFSASMA